MDKIYYYVDGQKYTINPCVIHNVTWIRFIKEDGTLTDYAQGFNEKDLFENEEGANKRVKYLHKLYFETFRYKPFLKENILVNYMPELLYIEKEITKQLNTYENFEGIDFCDVSAGGIQIRGHHKQIKNYTYGKQPTILYDFSNCQNCITEFVEMWKVYDTPEKVKWEHDFIRDGEKWGWD